MTPLQLPLVVIGRMSVDGRPGWKERVPASFDGVVDMPLGRIARMSYGHLRWIASADEAEAFLLRERITTHITTSPPPAAQVTGDGPTQHGSTGQNIPSPADLQEPSPERDRPPATAPNFPPRAFPRARGGQSFPSPDLAQEEPSWPMHPEPR